MSRFCRDVNKALESLIAATKKIIIPNLRQATSIKINA